MSFWRAVCVAVLLVAVLELVCTDSPAESQECLNVSRVKYVGNYESHYGHSDARPFYWAKQSNEDSCKSTCMANDECLAISLDASRTCSFYNTSDIEIVPQGTVQHFLLWKPCNMNEGDQPLDGRCRGRWVTFLQQSIEVSWYGSLGQMPMADNFARYQCRQKCLENRLCGFIAFDRARCVLVPKWPAEAIVYSKTGEEDSVMEMWTCVADFVETLNMSRAVRKPIDAKCTGYWVLAARHSSLSCQEVDLFHTQVYRECLAECDQYPSCRWAYYNSTYSVCVLGCNRDSAQTLHPPDMTFLEFRWVCVRNDSHRASMNADEHRLAGLGMKCSKIANNQNMFIGPDRCATCPPGGGFTRCDELPDIGPEWRIKNSCRLGQSYWAFPAHTRQLDIPPGYGTMSVARVFTGLELYWLAYLDDDDLVAADHLECRVFNASRPVERLDPAEIVSRADWQHQPAKAKIHPFRRTPTKIAIRAYQWPFYSCRTRAAGIDLMRGLQVEDFRAVRNRMRFGDVANNFYVDEHGNIYEGRGWALQSQAVGRHDPEAIVIGFIGWVHGQLPSERFLNAVKKLIELGIARSHIDRNYRLFVQKDMIHIDFVDKDLLGVVGNWYRYKGFMPTICYRVSQWLIALNLLAAATCLVLIRLFYGLYFFAAACENCAVLSRTSLAFARIFPVPRGVLPPKDKVATPEPLKLVHIIYERCRASSRSATYRHVVGLVVAWVHNTFLGSSSSRCQGNDLANNLRRVGVRRTACRVYEAHLSSHYCPASGGHRVIACVSGTASGVFLANLIRSGSCVCTYFRIERVDKHETMRDKQECVAIEPNRA